MEEEINKKWTNRKLVEETIKSMNLHNESSPETRERLVKLETNQTNIMEKLEELVIRFDKFEEKLDKALEKKADKWVEKILTWFGAIVGVGVIGYIGSLIVKVIENL